MNHHYRDIRDKLGAPQWWDEYAVPRYCDFTPGAVANIYARQAVLLEIACQGCGTRFRVAMTTGALSQANLEHLVVEHEIHYGDPPNAGCCPAGPTMNSEPRTVLEFWTHDRGDWIRRPELEVPIDCGWAA